MSHKKARHAAPRTVRARRTAEPSVPQEEEREEEHKHGGAAKPVSLWPLDFETAIRRLVGVTLPTSRGKS